jgi:gamma-glutamyltranspeptidase / glutathione hydrolase
MSQSEASGRGDRLTGLPHATRAAICAPNGAAATSQPLATQAAIEILRRGGTAMDAAIAANAVLGLVEPTGSGLGGDLFALVWDPGEKKLFAYNGSGRSPAGLDFDTARARVGDNGYLPRFGAVAVSVPGCADGWFALHGRFGRLSMGELLAPAIGYARDGFPLTPLIAAYWRAHMRLVFSLGDKGVVEETANARAAFTRDGATPRPGERWTNPDLARTYERLAAGGRAAFYEGEAARTLDAYMRRIGGWLRAEDLAGHEGEWVEPISTAYRGFEVWQCPPNTQGFSVLQMLNLVEGFDLAAMGPGSADALHVMIEAKKLAFADRARHLADPAFSPAPLAGLLSKAYAERRRVLIDMDRAGEAVEAGAPPGHGDTVYLTCADADGMMVSLIQSNYFNMGCGLVPDGLGFMLQNRGALFSFQAGHANLYAPSKRPLHTIIPGFVTRDGTPWLSYGVMGGAMQPQGHLQVLVNMIDFGMGPQEAGDFARWQHYGAGTPDDPALEPGGAVSFESGVAPEVLKDLRRRGHRIIPSRPLSGYGGYQAIRFDPEQRVYHAATEMRFDGMAAGF